MNSATHTHTRVGFTDTPFFFKLLYFVLLFLLFLFFCTPQVAPHTMLIYEETCADWLTGLFGAFSQSLAVATSYATLGVASVSDAVIECNVKVILCNYKDVEKLSKAVGDMPTLTHIIYTTNNTTEEMASKPPAHARGVQVLSFDEVCDLAGKDAQPNAPEPNNMAVVMYTSGSTGKPKGVMIRHSNLTASAAALVAMVDEQNMKEGEETYLAYLPAAHILELCVEFSMFAFGAEIG